MISVLQVTCRKCAGVGGHQRAASCCRGHTCAPSSAGARSITISACVCVHKRDASLPGNRRHSYRQHGGAPTIANIRTVMQHSPLKRTPPPAGPARSDSSPKVSNAAARAVTGTQGPGSQASLPPARGLLLGLEPRDPSNPSSTELLDMVLGFDCAEAKGKGVSSLTTCYRAPRYGAILSGLLEQQNEAMGHAQRSKPARKGLSALR